MRAILYTTRISPMFASLARAWQARAIAPAAVYIEAGPPWSWRRLLSRLRARADDSASVCRGLGWPYVNVATINDPAAVAAVARSAPDVALNVGAGILRKPILDVPRLGTLGSHMALLPAYRGMNVAEWAAFNGDPVGCSVFWIDEGIDTGDIVATRIVDASRCASVESLRALVNDAQITLLAQVSASIDAGLPGESRPQAAGEGRQFYRMHRDLRNVLDRRLARVEHVF